MPNAVPPFADCCVPLLQVLTTCRHEHLVPLLGICVDPTPMLVYPFVGQSLEWHLREPHRRAAIGWCTRLSVALSVSKGLQVRRAAGVRLT